jgi:hypothetical protein
VLWNRQLDEDAMDGRVIVQDVDLVDELSFGGRLGEVNEFAANASLWTIVSMLKK